MIAAHRGAAAAVALLLLAAACSTGDGDEPASQPAPAEAQPAAAPSDVAPELVRFYDQQLEWTGCDGEFECATLTVPLDYTSPAGETIELALLRVPAGDQSQRIGSLIVNPGGPGASGIEYARAARSVATKQVLERFDIVGFDPRGVGQSNPVDCLADNDLAAFVAADATPDDAGEISAIDSASAEFATGCRQQSESLLPHIGTNDVARDMDVLRGVLGDQQLHYLGKSYGTALGAAYADQFPQRVGRMVLDGALDPSLSGTDISLQQAAGFEQAFQSYVDACLETERCPLGSTKEQALARFDRLLADIDAEPLPADGRELTQSLAVLGVALPLYFDKSQGYPALGAALARALDGDGTALMTLADIYLGRESSGSFHGNQNEAIYAVNCLDSNSVHSVADVEAEVGAYAAASPRFGPYLAWGNLVCAHWPVPAANDIGPVTAMGAAPILVVGTTGDPATPYGWAVGLADQLESGVLLTYEGDVHTAYMTGSDCVDAAVDAYLLEGTPPSDGARC